VFISAGLAACCFCIRLASGFAGVQARRRDWWLLIYDRFPKERYDACDVNLLAVSVTSFALLIYGCANPAANKRRRRGQRGAGIKRGQDRRWRDADNHAGQLESGIRGREGDRSHDGSFKQFSGAVDLLKSDPVQSVVSISIDAASVVTDENDLTKH